MISNFVLHINIHSLVSKLDELKNILCYLQQNKTIVHLILLFETFLNDKNTNLCNIEGYKLVCNNRSNGIRGGVVIYVHESVAFKIRSDLTMNIENKFETIFVKAS